MSTPTYSTGFLTHICGPGDPADVMAQGLELAVEVERLGFDSFWVTQHHFGAEEGHVPSPLLFLAAVAQRTSRIELGVAVVTVPLEHPLRVAEDAAVLDLLSGGRLQLGLGPGADAPSYAAFDADFEARSDAHSRAWATIRSALDGETIAAGQPLTPHSTGLAKRLWRATGSIGSSEAAGADGVGLLLSRSSHRDGAPVGVTQRPLVDAYLEALPPTATPRVGLTRTVIPTDDPEQTTARAAEGIARWENARRRGTGETFSTEESDVELARRHSIHIGTDDEVREALAADPALEKATHLLYQVQPAHLDHEATLTAMTRLAALNHQEKP